LAYTCPRVVTSSLAYKPLPPNHRAEKFQGTNFVRSGCDFF
jgi:hypothetical protein